MRRINRREGAWPRHVAGRLQVRPALRRKGGDGARGPSRLFCGGKGGGGGGKAAASRFSGEGGRAFFIRGGPPTTDAGAAVAPGGPYGHGLLLAEPFTVAPVPPSPPSSLSLIGCPPLPPPPPSRVPRSLQLKLYSPQLYLPLSSATSPTPFHAARLGRSPTREEGGGRSQSCCFTVFGQRGRAFFTRCEPPAPLLCLPTDAPLPACLEAVR